MKRLHFDHLSGNRIWIILFAVFLILVVPGTFGWIVFISPAFNQWLFIAGMMILIVFMTKLFWHRNVVQWNSKGVVIRMNPFFGKSQRFSDIESTQMIDQFLTVTTRSGKELQLDLSEFPESDSKKLNGILMSQP